MRIMNPALRPPLPLFVTPCPPRRAHDPLQPCHWTLFAGPRSSASGVGSPRPTIPLPMMMMMMKGRRRMRGRSILRGTKLMRGCRVLRVVAICWRMKQGQSPIPILPTLPPRTASIATRMEAVGVKPIPKGNPVRVGRAHDNQYCLRSAHGMGIHRVQKEGCWRSK